VTLPRGIRRSDRPSVGLWVVGQFGRDTGSSCEPDEARGSQGREAYSLYVERPWGPSNEVWRSKLTWYQGLPGVRVVRSSSAFGFSMINVIFEDSVDLYFARSRVLERLNLLAKALPPGVVPTLGPDATGVGHVFWYTVEGRGHSLRELRAIQDWYIRYQLNSVPGVAEVASVGGVVRQYQIDVDPKRLRAFRIPISAVVDAVMRSNRNVGGNVVEGSGTWSVVRGLGLIESVKDLEQVVIGAEGGVPVFVRQVADVKVGDAFRVAALVRSPSSRGRRG